MHPAILEIYAVGTWYLFTLLLMQQASSIVADSLLWRGVRNYMDLDLLNLLANDREGLL